MTMREEFQKQVIGDSLLDGYEADFAWNIWQAAYRAGQKEMRERAAIVGAGGGSGMFIAEDIRALPIEGEP